jgi:NADH-quinone oxidoreductase subunit J
MLPGTFVFIFLALVVAGTALGMLLARNAVYSALFLVLNFATVALIYFILGAPFIALVQITVYAGSIMVLFLFVIMLLGAERMPMEEPLRGQRWAALSIGAIFLLEILFFLMYRAQLTGMIQAPPAGSGEPAVIGMQLFNTYALPFEVTGFLLLVATVGAILLTRGDDNIQKFRLISTTTTKKG